MSQVVKARELLIVDYAVSPSIVDFEIESHVDRVGIAAIDTRQLMRLRALDGEEKMGGDCYLRRLNSKNALLLDVRVMEELLKIENQHLIPKAWQKGFTCFFGTVYRKNGQKCVLYIHRFRSSWRWGGFYFHNGFHIDDFAASLKKKI